MGFNQLSSLYLWTLVSWVRLEHSLKSTGFWPSVFRQDMLRSCRPPPQMAGLPFMSWTWQGLQAEATKVYLMILKKVVLIVCLLRFAILILWCACNVSFHQRFMLRQVRAWSTVAGRQFDNLSVAHHTLDLFLPALAFRVFIQGPLWPGRRWAWLRGHAGSYGSRNNRLTVAIDAYPRE